VLVFIKKICCTFKIFKSSSLEVKVFLKSKVNNDDFIEINTIKVAIYVDLLPISNQNRNKITVSVI